MSDRLLLTAVPDHAVPDQAAADLAPPDDAVATEPVEPIAKIAVLPWPDPVLTAHGFDPRHAYVERFWLGVIGPSATWLIRRFARGLDENPTGFRVDLADTARALGLGEGVGKNSMVWRTIDRLITFHLAQSFGDRQLAVRTHLPPLTQRQLSRLPRSVQLAHDAFIAEHRGSSMSLPMEPDAGRPRIGQSAAG